MVRYADDFVILERTEGEAQEALAEVREWMAEAVLTLHPDGTRLVNPEATETFDFLGYTLGRNTRCPSRRSLSRLRDAVRVLTARKGGKPLAAVVKPLNRLLRGRLPYLPARKGLAAEGTRRVDSKAASRNPVNPDPPQGPGLRDRQGALAPGLVRQACALLACEGAHGNNPSPLSEKITDRRAVCVNCSRTVQREGRSGDRPSLPLWGIIAFTVDRGRAGR